MLYQRKTRDVWKLMVNYGYGHGWEHELTEFTIAEARQRLKEYRENCPQYPARIVMAREKDVARPGGGCDKVQGGI